MKSAGISSINFADLIEIEKIKIGDNEFGLSIKSTN